MQQINLYLPEFRPNREPVRAVHIVWAGAALLLMLIVISWATSRESQKLQQSLTQEQQAMDALQVQLKALSSQRPAQANIDLDEKIALLQKNLQKRTQVLSMISQENLGNDKGFSDLLNALAAASLETISLESFAFSNGGAYVEMAGVTRGADQIPFYLQRLRDNPSFSHVGFGVLAIERSTLAPGLLKFTLQKPVDEKNKKHAGGR